MIITFENTTQKIIIALHKKECNRPQTVVANLENEKKLGQSRNNVLGLNIFASKNNQPHPGRQWHSILRIQQTAI